MDEERNITDKDGFILLSNQLKIALENLSMEECGMLLTLIVKYVNNENLPVYNRRNYFRI